MEKSLGVCHNDSSSSLYARAMREPSAGLHHENLVGSLEIKFTKVWGPPRVSPPDFLALRPVYTQPPAIHQDGYVSVLDSSQLQQLRGQVNRAQPYIPGVLHLSSFQGGGFLATSALQWAQGMPLVFSVVRLFSCCKDGRGKFQAFYMSDTKPELTTCFNE